MIDEANNVQSELILHIGLPKTGTTAIQRYMYFNREAYAETGVHWAETYPNGIHEINDWAHHVYSHKWGGWLNPDDFVVSPDQAWQALAGRMQEIPGRYLVSSERLADILPTPVCGPMLSFIKNLIGPAKLTVIGYVRRQDLLIESHIRELIKGGNLTKTLDQYLEQLPSFVDFSKGFLNASEVVGPENIIVRVYERSILVDNDAVPDFLAACNIEPITGGKTDFPAANPSLNFLSSKVFLDETLVSEISGARYRQHFIRKLLTDDRFAKLDSYSLLTEQARADIMNRFEAGNRSLAEDFVTEEHGKHLTFDEGRIRPYLSNDDPALSISDLIFLLLALRPPRPQ